MPDAPFADPASADLPTDGLNPDQLDAVVHGDGPLLVVAGAGSGKTRVLTHRIAHLIHEGVPPSRILAITFTNKAADEMRQRVGRPRRPGRPRDVGVARSTPRACASCAPTPIALGYPRQFSIYDQADSVRLTGYVIRDLDLDAKRFTPRGVHASISLWKNELVDPDGAASAATHIFDRKHADVYREYQARLQKAGAMDFDDLLDQHRRLLRDHPDVLEHYRERFEHILVDEYQDTNQAQNEIVLMLAGGHQNVCVVGDTDQCLPPGTLVAHARRRRADRACRGRRRGPRHRRQVDATTGVDHATSTGPLRRAARHGHAPAGQSCSRRRRTTSCRPARATRAHLVYLMYRADRGYRIGARPACGRWSPVVSNPVPRPQQPGARRRDVDASESAERGRGLVLRIVVRGRVRTADGVLPRHRARTGDGRSWLRRCTTASTPSHGPRR